MSDAITRTDLSRLFSRGSTEVGDHAEDHLRHRKPTSAPSVQSDAVDRFNARQDASRRPGARARPLHTKAKCRACHAPPCSRQGLHNIGFSDPCSTRKAPSEDKHEPRQMKAATLRNVGLRKRVSCTTDQQRASCRRLTATTRGERKTQIDSKIEQLNLSQDEFQRFARFAERAYRSPFRMRSTVRPPARHRVARRRRLALVLWRRAAVRPADQQVPRRAITTRWWAWGSNAHGQLGSSPATSTWSPALGIPGAVSLAAGSWHTVALLDDGASLPGGERRRSARRWHQSSIHVARRAASVASGERCRRAAHTMALAEDGTV